ncbi:uncharacterized protein LA080_013970 [Diaporthe eres]|nr:uncharacterized protein LA080_013970 [Diaporthe eres]
MGSLDKVTVLGSSSSARVKNSAPGGRLSWHLLDTKALPKAMDSVFFSGNGYGGFGDVGGVCIIFRVVTIAIYAIGFAIKYQTWGGNCNESHEGFGIDQGTNLGF